MGIAKQSSLPSIYEDSVLPNNYVRDLFFGKNSKTSEENVDGIDIQNYHESEGSILSHFDPVSEEYVKSFILKAPIKSCDLDPIPTSLFSKIMC